MIDKDTVAAAVADAWYADGDAVGATAVIYVGTGIGVGSHSGAGIIRGASGNAGEIGHIILDPDGPACSCGARGCVAVTCAPSALVSRFAPDEPSIAEGLARIRRHMRDDAAARRAVDDAVIGLKRLTEVVARLYDVDRVVFGGPMWPFYQHLLDGDELTKLGTALSRDAVHEITVAGSPHALDLGAVGAACLVFDELLSPRTTQLMVQPYSTHA